MHRKYYRKHYRDFPVIQVRHGETESLDDLFYLNCPYGENIVVPYAIGSFYRNKKFKHKEYRIKTPFGMIADKERNGGALLVWYEKTSRGS